MTKQELAVIIPTRGRPANLNRVISAWDFTNAWDHADLIAVVDQDDPEIVGYRNLQQQTGHPDTGRALFTLMEMPVWMPMVHKLDVAAAALSEDEKYFALGFAGDDHLPQTIGWAKTYLDKLRELGTGMVYGDDGYQGKKLSTEWAVTSDAVRALGRMVPAPVEHMYCDNAMMDLFDAANALCHLPQVRIEHLNPYANGKAPMDAQYRRVNSREQYAKDGRAYHIWKAGQMLAQVAKLRALQPKRPGRLIRKEMKKMGTKSPFPSHFKQVRGATPVEIEVTLADLAMQVPGDQEIVELGVFQGKTALVMAWAAQQGGGAHITAIDAWDLKGNTYDSPFTDPGSKAWARYWVRGMGYANHITLVQGFSHQVAAEWVISPDLIGRGNRPVGMLFVDADHSYEGARRDIETWAPHLTPGAVIAVDDYHHPDWPGVAQAVDELVAEGFLDPITVFHDRLAVTRLAQSKIVKAVTSEGASSSPEGEEGMVSTLEDEWERVDPEGVARLRGSAAELAARGEVHEGELGGVPAGTPLEELNTGQLRTLARVRRIVLGARKDKRAEMIVALRAGK